MSSGLVEYFQV